REMETGVDVIQSTLRRTIKERDEARAEKEMLTASLQEKTGSSRTGEGRARDANATVEILATALAGTAQQRDSMAVVAMAAREETDAIAQQKRILETKNDVIFAK